MTPPHSKYWSTGIQLKWRYGDRWYATCDYQTFDFDSMSNDVMGTLSAKYGFPDPYTPAKLVVDAAKELGIEFKGPYKGPAIYIENDGEGPAEVPDNWREISQEVARKLGFDDSLYQKR